MGSPTDATFARGLQRYEVRDSSQRLSSSWNNRFPHRGGMVLARRSVYFWSRHRAWYQTTYFGAAARRADQLSRI